MHKTHIYKYCVDKLFAINVLKKKEIEEKVREKEVVRFRKGPVHPLPTSVPVPHWSPVYSSLFSPKRR